jgi:hypothetical protein
MKLHFARSQEQLTDRKGNSEGVTYKFSCRLELAPDEAELVARYNQGRHILCLVNMDDIRDFRPRDEQERFLSVNRLSSGWTVESRFVTDLARTEAAIKEGCADFKPVLALMATWGGETVVEI